MRSFRFGIFGFVSNPKSEITNFSSRVIIILPFKSPSIPKTQKLSYVKFKDIYLEKNSRNSLKNRYLYYMCTRLFYGFWSFHMYVLKFAIRRRDYEKIILHYQSLVNS